MKALLTFQNGGSIVVLVQSSYSRAGVVFYRVEFANSENISRVHTFDSSHFKSITYLSN